MVLNTLLRKKLNEQALHLDIYVIALNDILTLKDIVGKRNILVQKDTVRQRNFVGFKEVVTYRKINKKNPTKHYCAKKSL